ncbi:unnamed protein product, partial [Boreogadus saida]
IHPFQPPNNLKTCVFVSLSSITWMERRERNSCTSRFQSGEKEPMQDSLFSVRPVGSLQATGSLPTLAPDQGVSLLT